MGLYIEPTILLEMLFWITLRLKAKFTGINLGSCSGFGCFGLGGLGFRGWGQGILSSWRLRSCLFFDARLVLGVGDLALKVVCLRTKARN